MISVRNLTMKYGDLLVLDNLCVEIEKGEVISVIGPSGCGKSTFLRCLNLLEKPQSGEIWVDGEDILKKGTNANRWRERIGMVFQNFNLYSHLMVIENIMLGPVELKKTPKKEAFDEAMDYLEMVGLSQKAYAYPDELSGGQKQRVAIARCLAMKPEMILFDEPTSALDPTMVSEVLAVIRRLASKGLTMMIVTHEMKFARDVSTRVFFMEEMGIYEQGTPQVIFEAPQKPKTRAFINKIRAFHYLTQGNRFDLYGLNGELEIFLLKQGFSNKRIQMVQLVSEEVLCHLLPDVPVDYAVEYSDLTGLVTLNATYEGAECNPTGAKKGDLSLGIVVNCAREMNYVYRDKTSVFNIIMQ